MSDEFKITPSILEPNYIPNGVELPTEQTGFQIDDTPASNATPVEPGVNWDDVESVNKPDDNATNSHIFAQNSAPTIDFKEGDLWFDTDDNNTIYRANSALSWVSVKDGGIAGKITTFRQTGIPTSLAAGDIWYDSDDGDKQYRATAAGDDAIGGGEWIRVDVGANPTLIDALATTNAPAEIGADKTADHEAKAVYETYTAGSTFVTGEMSFVGSDGKMYHTDGLTSELDNRIIGIAMANITAGASGNFQVSGLVTGSGLTAGTKYYVKVPTPTGTTSTSTDTYNAADEGDSFCGQTFQVATTKPITHIRVKLYLSTGASVSNLALKIYATAAGIPTGSVLATSSGYTPTLTESTQNIDFYFATPFVPVASTTYCFVTSGTSTGYVRCNRDGTSYADGTALTQIDGGAWTATADDLTFGIYQGTGEIATAGSNKLVGIARTTTQLSLRI